MKKFLIKIVNHSSEEAFLDGKRLYVQLGHFNMFFIAFPQRLLRLTSLYLSRFQKLLLNFDFCILKPVVEGRKILLELVSSFCWCVARTYVDKSTSL